MENIKLGKSLADLSAKNIKIGLRVTNNFFCGEVVYIKDGPFDDPTKVLAYAVFLDGCGLINFTKYDIGGGRVMTNENNWFVYEELNANC